MGHRTYLSIALCLCSLFGSYGWAGEGDQWLSADGKSSLWWSADPKADALRNLCIAKLKVTSVPGLEGIESWIFGSYGTVNLNSIVPSLQKFVEDHERTLAEWQILFAAHKDGARFLKEEKAKIEEFVKAYQVAISPLEISSKSGRFGSGSIPHYITLHRSTFNSYGGGKFEADDRVNGFRISVKIERHQVSVETVNEGSIHAFTQRSVYLKQDVVDSIIQATREKNQIVYYKAEPDEVGRLVLRPHFAVPGFSGWKPTDPDTFAKDIQGSGLWNGSGRPIDPTTQVEWGLKRTQEVMDKMKAWLSGAIPRSGGI